MADFDNVPLQPTLTSPAYTGSDTHIKTDWWIEDINGNIVWQSLDDHINLLTIQVTGIVLQPNTDYTVKMIQYGSSSISNEISVTIKTRTVKVLAPTINIVGYPSNISVTPDIIFDDYVTEKPNVTLTGLDITITDTTNNTNVVTEQKNITILDLPYTYNLPSGTTLTPGNNYSIDAKWIVNDSGILTENKVRTFTILNPVSAYTPIGFLRDSFNKEGLVKEVIVGKAENISNSPDTIISASVDIEDSANPGTVLVSNSVTNPTYDNILTLDVDLSTIDNNIDLKVTTNITTNLDSTTKTTIIEPVKPYISFGGYFNKDNFYSQDFNILAVDYGLEFIGGCTTYNRLYPASNSQQQTPQELILRVRNSYQILKTYFDLNYYDFGMVPLDKNFDRIMLMCGKYGNTKTDDCYIIVKDSENKTYVDAELFTTIPDASWNFVDSTVMSDGRVVILVESTNLVNATDTGGKILIFDPVNKTWDIRNNDTSSDTNKIKFKTNYNDYLFKTNGKHSTYISEDPNNSNRIIMFTSYSRSNITYKYFDLTTGNEAFTTGLGISHYSSILRDSNITTLNGGEDDNSFYFIKNTLEQNPAIGVEYLDSVYIKIRKADLLTEEWRPLRFCHPFKALIIASYSKEDNKFSTFIFSGKAHKRQYKNISEFSFYTDKKSFSFLPNDRDETINDSDVFFNRNKILYINNEFYLFADRYINIISKSYINNGSYAKIFKLNTNLNKWIYHMDIPNNQSNENVDNFFIDPSDGLVTFFLPFYSNNVNYKKVIKYDLVNKTTTEINNVAGVEKFFMTKIRNINNTIYVIAGGQRVSYSSYYGDFKLSKWNPTNPSLDFIARFNHYFTQDLNKTRFGKFCLFKIDNDRLRIIARKYFYGFTNNAANTFNSLVNIIYNETTDTVEFIEEFDDVETVSIPYVDEVIPINNKEYFIFGNDLIEGSSTVQSFNNLPRLNNRVSINNDLLNYFNYSYIPEKKLIVAAPTSYIGGGQDLLQDNAITYHHFGMLLVGHLR